MKETAVDIVERHIARALDAERATALEEAAIVVRHLFDMFDTEADEDAWEAWLEEIGPRSPSLARAAEVRR